MNYIIEGVQGSGKTTLVRNMSKELSDYKVIMKVIWLLYAIQI